MGSAGGTFIRIIRDSPVVAHSGLMFMIGKHQMIMLRPGEDGGDMEGGEEGSEEEDDGTSTAGVGSVVNSNARERCVSVESLDSHLLPSQDNNEPKGGVGFGVASTSDEDNEGVRGRAENGTEIGGGGGDGDGDDKDVSNLLGLLRLRPQPSPQPQPQPQSSADSCVFNAEGGEAVLVVRCFAPEGTPIQGCEYKINREGASLGRKTTNKISFSQDVDGAVMGLDSSISGEHAEIVYDDEKKRILLYDGFRDKGSTNGTWLRLSAMHKQSKNHEIKDGSEILIGTVRFHCSYEEQVVEKDIEDQEYTIEDEVS